MKMKAPLVGLSVSCMQSLKLYDVSTRVIFLLLKSMSLRVCRTRCCLVPSVVTRPACRRPVKKHDKRQHLSAYCYINVFEFDACVQRSTVVLCRTALRRRYLSRKAHLPVRLHGGRRTTQAKEQGPVLRGVSVPAAEKQRVQEDEDQRSVPSVQSRGVSCWIRTSIIGKQFEERLRPLRVRERRLVIEFAA